MTEAEKELIQLIKDCNNTWKHEFKTSREVDLAKSIIAHYPQVLAEKVWEGDASLMDIDDLDKALSKYDEKQIKVYIEVVS
ncbi:MAG: hypothetical protein KBD51_04020 [Candidatus Levybacteria bacterium]|nr:hypothetical protein [Candidatus Levybacteria bacterium]